MRMKRSSLKMAIPLAMLFLVTFGTVPQMARADGTVTAYFFSVKNAGGLQKNGNCCDNLCAYGVSPCICNPFEECDTAINFCLNYNRAPNGTCQSDPNDGLFSNRYLYFSSNTLGGNEFTLIDPASFSRSFTGSLKGVDYDIRLELVDNDVLTTAPITDAVRSISSLKNTNGSVIKFTEEASWITFVWGYSVKCAKNYYGNDCGTYCDATTCGANGSCNLNSGVCDCKGNFTGGKCEACKAGYYGAKCDECQCANGTCSSGVAGDGTCTSCNTNYYGPTCNRECTCKNGDCKTGINGDGKCSACRSSFYGINCDKAVTCIKGAASNGIVGTGLCTSCDVGYYGVNCDAACKCNAVNGICSDGIFGDGNCKSCNKPTAFGALCDKKCTCIQGQCLNGPSGSGVCKPGSCFADFYGINCAQMCNCAGRACYANTNGNGTCFGECLNPRRSQQLECTDCTQQYWGSNCSMNCACVSGQCRSGLAGNGTCVAGSCRSGYFGINCDQPCTCQKGTCKDNTDGDGTCSSCSAGYKDTNCDKCSDGYYRSGSACLACTCKHGSCDLQSGKCAGNCQEGWTGEDCDVCASGFAGRECRACSCVHGECDEGLANSGFCKKNTCSVGYEGLDCQLCSVNRFGSACDACLCVNGVCNDGIAGNGMCNSTIGCHSGFSGPLCNILCTCNSANGVCDTGTSGNGTCKACNENSWGLNCEKACTCVNGMCSNGPNGTGFCVGPCFELKYGSANCDQCASEYFGKLCTKCLCDTAYGTCNDTIDGNGLCTRCYDGYSGRVCDVRTGASAPVPAGSAGGGGVPIAVVGGAIGGCVALLGCAFAIFYYRGHILKAFESRGSMSSRVGNGSRDALARSGDLDVEDASYMRGQALTEFKQGDGGLLMGAAKTSEDGLEGHDMYATIDALTENVIEEISRDRIRLGDNIGSGNFGDVWRGTLDTAGAGVVTTAVKSLKGDASAEQNKLFIMEAKLMAELNHPNIVRILGIVTIGKPVLIVLEFMSNGSLLSYLVAKKDDLSRKSLMHMCRDIAAGMVEFERRGLVHRDLAARNILVANDGTCKIADFGLARHVESDYYISTSSQKIPVKWTAPESIKFRKFSSHSDVWAFGVVCWEIFALGDKPYGQMTNAEALEMLDKGQRLARPEMANDRIYAAMTSCWAAVPHNRPSFVKLFAEFQGMIVGQSHSQEQLQPAEGYVELDPDEAYALYVQH